MQQSFICILRWTEEPLDFLPGQFVEVSIAGFGEAPITIASSPTRKDGFELRRAKNRKRHKCHT